VRVLLNKPIFYYQIPNRSDCFNGGVAFIVSSDARESGS